MLDTESWTVHSLAQKPKNRCLSCNSDPTKGYKDPQRITCWYSVFYVLSQTWKQACEQEGVTCFLCRGAEVTYLHWGINSNTCYCPSNLLDWVIPKHNSQFKRSVCDHQCKQPSVWMCDAVYRTGVRAVRSATRKPASKQPDSIQPMTIEYLQRRVPATESEYSRGLPSIYSHRAGNHARTNSTQRKVDKIGQWSKRDYEP